MKLPSKKKETVGDGVPDIPLNTKCSIILPPFIFIHVKHVEVTKCRRPVCQKDRKMYRRWCPIWIIFSPHLLSAGRRGRRPLRMVINCGTLLPRMLCAGRRGRRPLQEINCRTMGSWAYDFYKTRCRGRF